MGAASEAVVSAGTEAAAAAAAAEAEAGSGPWARRSLLASFLLKVLRGRRAQPGGGEELPLPPLLPLPLPLHLHLHHVARWPLLYASWFEVAAPGLGDDNTPCSAP